MKYLLLHIASLFCISVHAQVYNNGAVFHVDKDAIVSVRGTDFINNGEVTHSGFLLVDGSITNDFIWKCDSGYNNRVDLGLHWRNNDTFNAGVGTFNFIGNDQTIGGDEPSEFHIMNLKGDKLALKYMDNSIRVNTLLDLNDAELACNDYTALMTQTALEIDRNEGFVSTGINGRLNREVASSGQLPSLFPLGHNNKGNVVYRPIILKASDPGVFRSAFIYRDPGEYGMTSLNDSLCTINDEYFHIIGSSNNMQVDFSIVTQKKEEWTKLADWQGQWYKISPSGLRSPIPDINYGTENYLNGEDRAIVLASERPFVEIDEKLHYVPFKSSITLKPRYYLPENSNITWLPPDYLDCPDCPEPMYTAGLPMSYRVEVDNGLGCMAYDTVRIEVIRGEDNPILIPNAFSPNGDMLNDIFRPHLYSFEELINLKIYNRWGELIYDGIDGWDGTYMGKDVQMGAYMYMAEIKELLKGGLKRSNYVSGMVNVIR